jgi:predicted nucleic acid-binding protein
VDIRLLPRDTRCLVDSNVFVYHLGSKGGDCTAFFDRVAGKEIEAYITTTIIAEVLHRQMLVEAVLKGRITPGKSLNKLKDNPEIITGLTDYITEVGKLLELPIRIITVQPDDITCSHDLRRAHGLFVNDSINLACAQRFGLSDIATHDADFRRVPDLRLWEPTDIRPQ